MERLNVIGGHLGAAGRRPAIVTTSETSGSSSSGGAIHRDDDVVIVSARRTPICRANRGHFKDTLPDDLLSAAFSAVLQEAGLDPSLVGDICVGNVLQPGGAAQIGRIAQFFSGIPDTVPL